MLYLRKGVDGFGAVPFDGVQGDDELLSISISDPHQGCLINPHARSQIQSKNSQQNLGVLLSHHRLTFPFKIEANCHSSHRPFPYQLRSSYNLLWQLRRLEASGCFVVLLKFPQSHFCRARIYGLESYSPAYTDGALLKWQLQFPIFICESHVFLPQFCPPSLRQFRRVYTGYS